MATVDDAVQLGMPAEPAKVVAGLVARFDGLEGATLTAEKLEATTDLMALGIHAHLADAIVEDSGIPALMALGLHQSLAVVVDDLIDAG